MLDEDALARFVVLPAVVAAREPAPLHLAERQLQLAVRAPVLERARTPVRSSVDGKRPSPEDHLPHLLRGQLVAPERGIPVVGVEPGSPLLLTPRASVRVVRDVAAILRCHSLRPFARRRTDSSSVLGCAGCAAVEPALRLALRTRRRRPPRRPRWHSARSRARAWLC